MHHYLWFSIVTVSFYVDFCLACLDHSGCEVHGKKLSCNKYFDLSESSRDVEIIEVCHLNKTELYLNTLLHYFPNLTNITIKFSSFRKIETKPFTQHDNLESITFNNISITKIDETIFSRFKNLKVLDLRNNSLQLIHGDKVYHLKNISTIYLSGNKWNCSKNLDWIYHFNESVIKDLKDLTCFNEPLDGKPLYYISEVIHQLNRQCPSPCQCSLVNIFRNSDIEELQPVVEVDCSKKNFTVLPEFLPKHGKILKISDNAIEDLTPLIRNPIYREVTDLYVDHNLINNIEILEGSYWLKNFRVLSLKGNKLSELPTYAIDNALQQNPNMPNAIMLYLGNNPWRCDCIFTPSFQEDLLVKYESQIQDMSDIKCSYVEGDKNSRSSIVQLSRSAICQLPSDYSIRALDLVNGVLASLIVLVLGKLAYDYYYFKTTGKLPWIVTKMP